MLAGKVFRDTLFLNGASFLAQALALGQSLLLMRFLDPGDYGLWIGLNVLLAYAGFSHLGLEHGMGNRLPYHLGRNDADRAASMGRSVYWAWTALAFLAAAAVALWAFLQRRNSVAFWGLLTVSGLIIFVQQIQYLARHRTSADKNFAEISRVTALRSVLTFLLVVPLAWKFGVYGLMAGTVTAAAAVALGWRTRVSIGRAPISRDTLGEAIRVGFPIALASLGSIVLETLDRVVILAWLGEAGLGAYGVTTLAAAACTGVLSQAGSALSPHMAEEMGRRADEPAALEKFLVRPTLALAGLAAILIMTALWLLPILVRSLLPKYLPGLPALAALAPGLFFLAVILTANNVLSLILIARGRQRILIYLQAFVIALKFGLAAVLLDRGWGLPGAALACTVSYAIYSLTILGLAARLVLPAAGARLRFLGATMVPLVVAAALFGSGMIWIPKSPIPAGLQTGAHGVLLLLAIGLIAVWLERRTGILRLIAKSVSSPGPLPAAAGLPTDPPGPVAR